MRCVVSRKTDTRRLIRFAVVGDLLDGLNVFGGGGGVALRVDGSTCSRQIGQIRPVNISIARQPSLFSLDSGREVRQSHQFYLLSADLQLSNMKHRIRYAEAGLYMNGKLARAQLLAADENREVSENIYLRAYRIFRLRSGVLTVALLEIG